MEDDTIEMVVMGLHNMKENTIVLYGFPNDPELVSTCNYVLRHGRELEFRSLDDVDNIKFLYESGHKESQKAFLMDEDGSLFPVGSFRDVIKLVEGLSRL